MAPKERVIIDTDPGVDDVLCILLALAAKSEELEVMLLSVTFGNVDVRTCLRNVVATFHILDQEIAWRKEKGLPVGFEGVTKYQPLVAIGAAGPLHDTIESADYFHGRDGLAGIHTSHPHFTPEESWQKLFETPPPKSIISESAESKESTTDLSSTPIRSFKASLEPAHKEILRLLRENEPNTITLVAIGPLTNFALAAAEDPETFLRAKEVVTMGGAIDLHGNVTPVAEFNVYADPVAAARVYALSSPKPASTMPPVPAKSDAGIDLPAYPPNLTKQLRVVLMALDITEQHVLTRGKFNAAAQSLADQGSPLARWLTAFMTPMLDKMERLHTGHEGDGSSLALHDPMTIWYVLSQDRQGDNHTALWQASPKSPEDVRIETTGQWTRGMTIGDRRARRRRDSDGERPHDRDNWLGNQSGNRIWRMLQSPGTELAAVELLERVFGVSQ